jgi:predicted secreted acid phosphatase
VNQTSAWARRGLVAALTVVLVGSALPTQAAPKKDAPSRDQWLADVRTAMDGSRAYVKDRIADAQAIEDAGEEPPRLAINLDIDNTVIATYYDGGGPIPFMRRFAHFADDHGVALLFNTGRTGALRASTLEQLRKAGYPVTGLCLRRKGEQLAHGKQRCRQRFVDRGFAIIANIGNRSTDFEGANYDRAFRLPDYDGALG